MTLRRPDPRGSRAVLIGTSRYDSDLPDLLAVRNNLEVLQELLTSDAFGGFPRGRCTVGATGGGIRPRLAAATRGKGACRAPQAVSPCSGSTRPRRRCCCLRPDRTGRNWCSEARDGETTFNWAESARDSGAATSSESARNAEHGEFRG